MLRFSMALLTGILAFALSSADLVRADDWDGYSDSVFEAIADAADVAGQDLEPTISPEVGPLSTQEMLGRITTARRRTENVLRTPVAVSTFDTSQLESDQVRRTSDLNGLVPSLAIDGSVGRSTAARITLRGVGEGDFLPSTDPGIGLFVDGVYEPRQQGLLTSIYDVDRLEVVRGPQGVLFGKNTIGGAINVITKKPQFELDAGAALRVGDEDLIETQFMLNLPLSEERAALRLSGATRFDDGYVSNALTGRRLGTDRLLSGRAQLLLLPQSDVELLLTVDRSREPRRTQGGKCVPTTRPPASGIPQVDSMLDDLITACAQEENRSERKIASEASAQDRLVSTNASAQLTWQMSPEVQLRSITAYRRQDNDVLEDLDGTPFGAGGMQTDLNQDSFSQEFQLTGSLLDGRLSYVAGAFALSEDSDSNLIDGVAAIGSPQDAPFGLPLVEEFLKVNNQSFAAFGQLSFDVTDRLNVSVGLRRTVERKRVSKEDFTIDLSPGSLFFGFERSKRFSNFSPNASVSFQVNPRLLVYVAYSTGFRSGGFNGRADLLNQDTGRISPEELTSYEFGVKSSFFADRLVLNVASYYSVLNDAQRPIPTTASIPPPLPPGTVAPPGVLISVPVVVVRNAAEARLYGAEVELAAQLLPSLRFETTASSFRNRYTRFDFSSDSGADDARQPQQPNYLVRLALEYSRDLGVFGGFDGRVTWTHRGSQGNDVLDSRAIRQNKFGLLDARLGFALPDGTTNIAFFGTNLLDREYFNNGIDLTPSLGIALRFPGPPRRYGVEIRRSL